MKMLFFLLTVGLLTFSEDQVDKDLSVRLEFTNIITGTTARYTYNDKVLKVFLSKEGNLYKSRCKRRIDQTKDELLRNKLDKLITSYRDSVIVFSDPLVLDGFRWTLYIEKDNIKRKFIIVNCYNENINTIIEIFNDRLKGKKAIFKTGFF